MATRSVIRDKLRQRADIQSDTMRFPDSELNQYLNDSLKKLQSKLFQRGLLKDEATQEFVADGSSNYALPDDYGATLAVFKREDDYVRRLHRHRSSDRPFAELLFTATEALCYRTARFNGVKSLELAPRATSGTYLHTYVPIITLDADTDELDDILAWDEYLVLDSAIKCRMKDNMENSEFLAERERVLQEIYAGAEALDLNEAYIMRPPDRHNMLYSDAADQDLLIRRRHGLADFFL